MYCKVKNCRYNDSHTTAGHRCGICKKSGHGQSECSDIDLKNYLSYKYGKDKLPEDVRCTILNCRYKWSHKNIAHHCKNCGANHAYNVCPHIVKKKEIYKIECPICRIENDILVDQKKMYGLEELCKVCMDKPIEIFLPKCGHSCICSECLQEMDKLKSV